MRVGAEDAEFLVKQFEPVFDKNDLINIDNFNGYIKLLINGATSPSFNIRFNQPPKGDAEIGKSMKQLSRLKYGREKAVVEKEILERGKPALPPEKPAPPLSLSSAPPAKPTSAQPPVSSVPLAPSAPPAPPPAPLSAPLPPPKPISSTT